MYRCTVIIYKYINCIYIYYIYYIYIIYIYDNMCLRFAFRPDQQQGGGVDAPGEELVLGVDAALEVLGQLLA